MVCAQTGQGPSTNLSANARIPEPEPDAGAVVLGCLACGHVLGRTTATTLAVNGVVLTQATVLVCSSCGKRRHWKPLKNGA